MPHTNSRTSTATKRKQAKPVHTRRVIVEDEEGWTHVVGGKTHKSRAVLNTKTEKGDFSIGQFQYMNKTIEELQREYESVKKGWEKSAAYVEVKRLFGNSQLSTVDNVVVFGLGTFQALEVQHSRTSLMQLCALQTILETLGREMPVVQQDPAFTGLDKEFLSTFRHKVAEDPIGYNSVNPTSLIYAIHCYPDVYDGIRKSATPAMLIGNNLKGEEPTAFNNLENFKELPKLYEGLEVAFTMPQFGNSFSSSVVFISKDEGEDTQKEQQNAKEVQPEEVSQLIEKLQI